MADIRCVFLLVLHINVRASIKLLRKPALLGNGISSRREDHIEGVLCVEELCLRRVHHRQGNVGCSELVRLAWMCENVTREVEPEASWRIFLHF